MRHLSLALGTLLAWSFGAAPLAAQPSPIGPEFQVNTYTTNEQRFVQLASDSAGNFVVVWGSLGQDGDGYGVFGQRFDATGNPLSGEFQVNTYTTGNQGAFVGHPAVAMNSSGEFVVVWGSAGQDGSSYGVFGQRYDALGNPVGGEFQANAGTIGPQFFPVVGMDDSGGFVVVWPGYFGPLDSSFGGVVGRRFDAAGAPVGGDFQVNTYTTDRQGFPGMSMTATGEFVVVWGSNLQDGSNTGVFGQRYDAAANPVGPEFQVNTYTTGYQSTPFFFTVSGPEVAMNSAGDFVVVWDSYLQGGDHLDHFGQRYDAAGNPVGPEFQINTYTTGPQLFADIDINDNGEFVVVWFSRQDSDNYAVIGRYYDSTGTPVTAEFQINTYTTDSQAAPDVTMEGQNFVVAWHSNTQDGDVHAIEAQRFLTRPVSAIPIPTLDAWGFALLVLGLGLAAVWVLRSGGAARFGRRLDPR